MSNTSSNSSIPEKGQKEFLTIQAPQFKGHVQPEPPQQDPGPSHQFQNFQHQHPRPNVWRKTLEEHNKHEKFLEEIDTAVVKTMNDRFINPHFVERSPSLTKAIESARKQSKEKDQAKSTIPWRKVDDQKNPSEERRKLFNIFNLTGGELPKSPLSLSQADLMPLPPKSDKAKKTEKPKLRFQGADQHLASHRSPTPYSNIAPKVDTGLSQLKKEKKYTPNGIPINDEKNHRLTLGSRLPRNFTGRIERFRAAWAAKIADVTNRLYNGGSGRDVSHYYPPYSREPDPILQQQQTVRKKQAPAPRAPPKAPEKTILKEPENRSQIQVIRPPITSTFDASSVSLALKYDNYPSHGVKHYNLISPNYTAHYRANQAIRQRLEQGQTVRRSPGATPGKGTDSKGASKEEPKWYKPSQLLPLHIPGPKYDNIYIGSYSGSESDRDSEDNMDRPVKSRKR